MSSLQTIKKRLNYNPLSFQLKSKRNGIALLLAMTSLLLMVFVASEVSTDSTIEYVVNSHEINRIKAYYAARNSLDIALLRVKTYQQAAKMNLPGGFAQQLNKVWEFPFAWPLPITEEMLTGAKDSVENATKESLFDGNYTHTITDEGSKIDINDLGSPSKTLREVTQKQILNIFENKINSDEKFREKYQNFNFTELINRVADWMSDKNTSYNGGDKRSPFRELGDNFPPNRGFRTLDEIRLVPGMTEEFFSLIYPSITIYGSKAINPNTASMQVLKSLDTGLTEEAIRDAIARREDTDKGGPFQGASSDECRNAFKSFVESRGARLNPEFDKIPFICDKVSNFKIETIGRSGSGKGSIQKKITVYVIDIQKAGSTIKGIMDKEKQQQQQQAGQTQGTNPGPKPTASAQEPLPKGRPRIVYWSEQ